MIGDFYKEIRPEAEGFNLLPDKPAFTCNSVLTVAVMDSLLNGRDYKRIIQFYGRKYPDRGYGTSFTRWLRQDDPKPYNTWNNGAALRASPIGFAGRTLLEVLEESRKSAEISHNHPDGIKGAQAIASSVFLAKNGRKKEEIRDYIESEFQYNLQRTIEEIRPGYFYDPSCQGTVPEAIIAFLDSSDFESAIKLSISLGGDSRSLASISGGIAQAYYKKLPHHIAMPVIRGLSPDLYKTIIEFSDTYPLSLFH